MMEFRQMIGHFQDLLAAKGKERNLHNNLVDHPLGGRFGRTVAQWHLNEMEAFLTEINKFRKELNKSPISAEVLYNVETSACGHVDYSSKLALYATELVLRTA